VSGKRPARHRQSRRWASLDVGLGKEAGIEELERAQQILIFRMKSIGLVDSFRPVVFSTSGRRISLDQAARACMGSLLLSYLHASDLRFWIAVKTTFAVVSFRKRITRTLLSPMSVP
jgi:hypothetical protein